MTGLIRMLPDDVRGMAHQVDLTVEDLYNMPGSIRSLATSLQSNWQGGKAARYADKLRQLAGRLHGETINLQRLARQVRNEVDQWEEADKAQGIKSKIPAYVISPGEGPLEKKPENIYKPIKSIVDIGKITKSIIDGGSHTYLPPYDGNPLINIHLPPWLGPALHLISGLIIVGEVISRDSQEFANPNERNAAIMVDLLFEAFIYLLKFATKKAGENMIRSGVGAMLTGVFAGPALVTALVGGLLWVVGHFGLDYVKKWYYGSTIRISIINAVTK